MKSFTPLSFVLITTGFLTLGCAEVRLTKHSAFQIANHAVERRGYRLADYYKPKVLREEARGLWIQYQARVPLTVTNHLNGAGITNYLDVWVDAKTKTSQEVLFSVPSALD
jgi:hypothetical protein